ncbi:non-ribosomal peptide synthetase, partial [Chitinophaga varians]|uniref:non-ribosomal peptide synthetase n=1 Tax=Chitinophaga varians TaxID=2202339 RepID=UPI00165F66AF
MNIITKLRKLKIELGLVDGKIRINAPEGILTAELLAEIKSQKDDIISYITNVAGKKQFASIPLAAPQEYFPLTSAQRQLYFLHAFNPDSLAYNLPYIIELKGELDKERLTAVFNQLLLRHESLRTSFDLVDEVPVQKIGNVAKITLEHYEATTEEEEAIIKTFVRPFDLRSAPLIRVGLLALSANRHLLMVDMHHIITDGISLENLGKEFMALYNDEVLPDLPLQYKDYAVWQQQEEQKEGIGKQEQYWLGIYDEQPVTLAMPADFPRPVDRRYTGAYYTCDIDSALTDSLSEIAKSVDATMFMATFTIFNVLLSKLGNQDDIVTGIPVAGRQHSDLENIIGMFVNTLAVRNNVKGEMSFMELLEETRNIMLAAFEHQTYPYEMLVEKLKIERVPGRNPLFDVKFVFQNYQQHERHIPGLTTTSHNYHNKASQFDMTLYVIASPTTMQFEFNYSTELFKEETIARFAAYFRRIITAVTARPHIRIMDIDMLPDAEKNELLQVFNNTRSDYPHQKTMTDLFEEQVKMVPDHHAVIDATGSITYERLQRRVNQLAVDIKKRKAHLVAIYAEPSIDMIAAILAVWKVGAAFIPLDPQQHAGRQEVVLAESGCDLLLIQARLAGGLRFQGEIMLIGNTDGAPQVLSSEASPESTAYVIYTSGSTGAPKGVKISQANLVNYVCWVNSLLELGPDDRSVLTSSFAFDLGYTAVFPVLASGGTLHLIPQTLYQTPDGLLEYIKQQGITYLKMTPTLFSTLLEADNLGDQVLDGIRFILLGGEPLRTKDVATIRQQYEHIRFINHYGPTETTIGTVAGWMDPVMPDTGETIIGRPVNNNQVFILDRHQQLVPVGTPGELVVGGAGVGMGYLHNDALTAEKFIQLPFAAGKVYRTGDQAQWLSDGRIRFIGRIDDQVKIRGYRVEPAEIAAHLAMHELVKEAVVVAKEQDGQRLLVAYYVSEKVLSNTVLKEFLNKRLPAYMVPAYYVQLEKIPLTLNGKVNRKALPDPNQKEEEKYVAPDTLVETLLVEIWTKVLGVEKVGITDNFFAIGGDSIKSIQIAARVKARGYKLGVNEIFTSQTIRELAGKAVPVKAAAPAAASAGGNIKITPVQQRFFDGPIRNKHHYNQSVLIKFDVHLSAALVKNIFGCLQRHHDALQMVFVSRKGQIVPAMADQELPVWLEEHTVENESVLLPFYNSVQSGIDIAKGPLMKLGLFHVKDGSQLLIVIHHLVVDGISWRILFEDIEQLYQQAREGAPLQLPDKTDAFGGWGDVLTAYTHDATFMAAGKYWSDFHRQSYSRIPRDFSDGQNTFADRETAAFRLSPDTTARLLTTAPAAFKTKINDLLLAALGLAIRKQYGLSGVCIDMESHGREDIRPDVNISRTVGWFTSIYPVCLTVDPDSISRSVRMVKESLRNTPNNGLDYLLEKYNGAAWKDLSVSTVCFNYLGQFDADINNRSYQVLQEAAGNETGPTENRPYDWDISGMVINGSLELSLTFSRHQYKQEQMDAFMAHYEAALLKVIDYCCNTTGTILSPSDTGCPGLSIAELDTLQEALPVEDLYPLSPMQEGFFFHHLLAPDDESYFEQKLLRITGMVDVDTVKESMNDLLSRYDILRTVYLHEGYTRPLQVVLKERQLEFHYEDVQERCRSGEEADALVRDIAAADRARGFNLGRDVLMRLTVVRSDVDTYWFIWSHPHILMDGWCLGIIISDFRELYAAKYTGRAVRLPAVRPYASYIRWLQEQDSNVSRLYWQQYLSGYEGTSCLPQQVQQSTGYHAGVAEVVLDNAYTTQLTALSRDFGVTLNTLLQTAWGVLLMKYGNTDDVVFGSVVSGRPADLPDVERMVGLFINTVPVRIRTGEDTRLCDLVKQLQTASLDALPHHYQPLADIQALSAAGRKLIDHLFIFENYPFETAETEDLFRIDQVAVFDQTHYDLTLTVMPSDMITVRMEYNRQVYTDLLMQQVSAHLREIIDAMINTAEKKISELPLSVSPQLAAWCQGEQTELLLADERRTFTVLFAEQAARTPLQVAVKHNGQELTYQELYSFSEQIAFHLQQRGVVAGDRVALYMPRGIHMLAAILGVFRCGA